MESSCSAGASGSSAAALSSSSAAESSSSVAKSSSSKANWAYLNPAISYGEFTDDRDGQAYKYVKIGTQMWMAENLNYADSAAMPDLKENSWCYNDGADSCAKYGRLYTWAAAMNIASSYLMILAGAVISTPQQGVCPAGWHLPTSGEWAMLATAVGGSDSAGTKLKSTSGWGRWYSDGSGTDDYGFSALPAGNREIAGGFYDAGANAHFWNATEYDSSKAYYRDLDYMVDMVGTNYYDKRNAFSVRCVQD